MSNLEGPFATGKTHRMLEQVADLIRSDVEPKIIIILVHSDSPAALRTAQ